MLKLVMFDESNSGTNGLRISLFEKNKLALPNLQAGDLLMIRLVQVSPHTVPSCTSLIVPPRTVRHPRHRGRCVLQNLAVDRPPHVDRENA